MTQYTINLTNDTPAKGAITVLEDDGRIRTWTSADPNFQHVLAAVNDGKSLDEVIVYRIPENITQLSPRVTLQGESLCFDGKVVEGPIQETAARFQAEGRELTPLVNFMENLADNVSMTTRNELFRWLSVQRLEIDEEGYVIGYRGLTSDMHSQHSGGAFVLSDTDRFNGVTEPTWVDGHVPNFVGSIISMPRSQVDDNSGVGCSFGLHVGSEEYARSWADRDTTIVVRVNPADVVSVPINEESKMRVCRYEILSELAEEIDHEPESHPIMEVLMDPEEVDAILDETIPEDFRKKMSRTQRFVSKFRR
jgi:hypothetical protein